MLKYGIACSLNETSTRSPIVLRGPIEKLCEEASSLGYQGLEIQLADPMQYDWKQIKKVCSDYHLELIAFATGRELSENGLCLLSDDAQGAYRLRSDCRLPGDRRFHAQAYSRPVSA